MLLLQSTENLKVFRRFGLSPWMALQWMALHFNGRRIPLVLTYHPLNDRIKRILLGNFNILSADPATTEKFPRPPLVEYRRDQNVRDILVHTADRNSLDRLAGSSACQHAWFSRRTTLQYKRSLSAWRWSAWREALRRKQAKKETWDAALRGSARP